MPVPYHDESTTTTTHTPPPSSSKWGPYTSAADFSGNMVIILVILFCALILVLVINAVIRYLLCSFRRHPQPSEPEKCSDSKAQSPAAESLPTMIFSASAATKLAGAEAECAICLAEFADGDPVRALPACNHGFHVSCIEKWLHSKKSCPTCRASCQVAEV